MKIKRRIISLLFALLLISPSLVFGMSGEDVGIDIVVVIDNSGSMEAADEDRLAVDAAIFVVDAFMPYAMSNSNSIDFRFGVVVYDNNGRTAVPLDTIAEHSRDDLISTINSAYNPRRGNDQNTNTPDGMRVAIDMLSANAIGNRQYIILLTDGNDNYQRATLDERRTNEARRLQEQSITVFGIGFEYLNALMSEEERARFLDNIQIYVDAYDGERFHINTNDDFNPTMRQIYTLVTQNLLVQRDRGTIPTGGRQEFIIDIKHPYVETAMLFVFTRDDVNFTVHFQNEDVTSKANIINDMDSYGIVQLSYPTVGEWTITMEGTENAEYMFDTIINPIFFNVHTYAEVVDNENILVGELEDSEGNLLEDPRFYEGAEGWFYLIDAFGELIERLEAAFENGVFRAVLPEELRGDIVVNFVINFPEFTRSSEPTHISIPILIYLSSIGADIGETVINIQADDAVEVVVLRDGIDATDGDFVSVDFADPYNVNVHLFNPASHDWIIRVMGTENLVYSVEHVLMPTPPPTPTPIPTPPLTPPPPECVECEDEGCEICNPPPPIPTILIVIGSIMMGLGLLVACSKNIKRPIAFSRGTNTSYLKKKGYMLYVKDEIILSHKGCNSIDVAALGITGIHDAHRGKKLAIIHPPSGLPLFKSRVKVEAAKGFAVDKTELLSGTNQLRIKKGSNSIVVPVYLDTVYNKATNVMDKLKPLPIEKVAQTKSLVLGALSCGAMLVAIGIIWMLVR